MKKILLSLIMFSVSLVHVDSAFADEDENRVFDITYEDVDLSTVTTDIHLRVFTNEEDENDGVTALAIHGFVHTAASWQPFVRELFRRSDDISRVVAVDLPGHGGSTIKSGVFGTLKLDDYVDAVFDALDLLDDALKPTVIIGHSQGALVVQMMQAERNLAELGITEAMLLAAVAPDAVPWDFAENGTAAQVLTDYLCPNEFNSACFDESVWGPHVAFPNPAWIYLFFTNLEGELVSGAPRPRKVERRGYSAPAPLFASADLIGFPPSYRPFVGSGVFAPANGTALTMLAYENDIIVRPDENRALYEYLTGDSSFSGFAVIEGKATVHDLHISGPRTVTKKLFKIIGINDDDYEDEDSDDGDDD